MDHGRLTWHALQKLLLLTGQGLLLDLALQAAWKLLQQLEDLGASVALPVLPWLLPTCTIVLFGVL